MEDISKQTTWPTLKTKIITYVIVVSVSKLQSVSQKISDENRWQTRKRK